MKLNAFSLAVFAAMEDGMSWMKLVTMAISIHTMDVILNVKLNQISRVSLVTNFPLELHSANTLAV